MVYYLVAGLDNFMFDKINRDKSMKRLFNPPTPKHVLKRAESHHRCEVNTLRIFACKFSPFLRFLKRIHFSKSPTESERSDGF